MEHSRLERQVLVSTVNSFLVLGCNRQAQDWTSYLTSHSLAGNQSVIRVSFARLVNGSLLSSFTCFIGGLNADEPAAKKIRNGAAVVQSSLSLSRLV